MAARKAGRGWEGGAAPARARASAPCLCRRLAPGAKGRNRDQLCKPAGTAWQDHDELALPKGDLAEAVNRQRAAIAAKQAEIKRAKARVRDARARRAREQLDTNTHAPDLTGLNHDRDMVFPVERLRVEMFNTTAGTVGFTTANGGSGLVAWLFRDALLERIDSEIEQMIGADEGMAPSEQEVVASRLEGKLMELERLDAEMT